MRQFARSGDASVVLDPAAPDEARRLREAVQPADGDQQGIPVDVLTTLAYLHLARYRVLPEGQDQEDLRESLALFGVLADRAPERVPGQVLSLISTAREEPASGGDRHTAAGARAFSAYQQTGRPEELDVAVTAFQGAVTVTPPGRHAVPRLPERHRHHVGHRRFTGPADSRHLLHRAHTRRPARPRPCG
jgi:hypothetical protein